MSMLVLKNNLLLIIVLIVCVGVVQGALMLKSLSSTLVS